MKLGPLHIAWVRPDAETLAREHADFIRNVAREEFVGCAIDEAIAKAQVSVPTVDDIRHDYMAPYRGVVIAALLRIPFWLILGVVIGLAVS